LSLQLEIMMCTTLNIVQDKLSLSMKSWAIYLL